MYRSHGSCSRKLGALGLLKCYLRMSSYRIYIYKSLCSLHTSGCLGLSLQYSLRQYNYEWLQSCISSQIGESCRLLTIWTCSWAGSEAIQLVLRHSMDLSVDRLRRCVPAQLLPCTLAILALESHIMIQDSLDSFLKGARHSPPEEMILECSLNSHQVLTPHKNIAVDKVQCRPVDLTSSTRSDISLSYNGVVRIQTCTGALKCLENAVLRNIQNFLKFDLSR